jgi:hypothetical protein
MRQRRRAWVAAKIDIFLHSEVEGCPHLGQRPMRQAEYLETSRQALSKPCWTSSGAEPRRIILIGRLAQVSSSHKGLTDRRLLNNRHSPKPGRRNDIKAADISASQIEVTDESHSCVSGQA